MAKSPGPAKCVHCLADPVERNWDHVFPISWYPDTTPPNLDKWKIPSCISCNDMLGIIEDNLLVHLAHALDPHHPASAGLYERARRAINPEAGRNERDRGARTAKKQRFLGGVLVGEAIPEIGVLPGLHDRWNQPPSERMAILLPKDGVDQLTKKIVRGISFIEGSFFVEAPYRVEVFVLAEEGATAIRRVIEPFGKEYARGPGIAVRRVVAADDSKSALFEIEFFQQFKTYASVMRS